MKPDTLKPGSKPTTKKFFGSREKYLHYNKPSSPPIMSLRELEEAVLAGGAAANAVRDYERKLQEMNEEKKVLDCKLA
ncbi:microtubule-associated protein 70-3 [Artemisia annua]|uniref:Microtubule-associated protein 70-3 n=1 Tax=Artemisia annua TaxID=35608 RepID=A0A2U1L848_ARTAN|nr:microtubule-associated protein 70-3 [Artemisia annua]